jgi:hypothetical protein
MGTSISPAGAESDEGPISPAPTPAHEAAKNASATPSANVHAKEADRPSRANRHSDIAHVSDPVRALAGVPGACSS